MQANELLAQVDTLKVEIDKLRPLKPEVERRIMQKFRLDWNYHSNAIEGNSLTLGETRAFLLEGLTANGKPMKDHLDIKGHDDLITFLESFIQQKEVLTEAAIREMHKILLKEPYETDAVTTDGRVVKKKVKLGAYKTEPNFVRMKSGEVHQYVMPEDVPSKMADLVAWHRQADAKNDVHPVAHAALFHYLFASIHPFDDGNGRMARILMNLILMRAGFPPVVIKLQNREPYIAALRKADAGENGDIVSFIGQNLIDAETLYLRGAKGESIEDFDDIDKRIALLKQQLQHVEEPLEINSEVQKNCFIKWLKPLLSRFLKKTGQLDDLYSRNQMSMSCHQWQGDGTSHWNTPYPLDRTDIIPLLEDAINTGVVFHLISCNFHWLNFKKAGLNTFSENLQLVVTFQKLQYNVSAQHGATIVFEAKNVYQTPLSEEKITQCVSNLIDACLKHIEQEIQRGKK